MLGSPIVRGRSPGREDQEGTAARSAGGQVHLQHQRVSARLASARRAVGRCAGRCRGQLEHGQAGRRHRAGDLQGNAAVHVRAGPRPGRSQRRGPQGRRHLEGDHHPPQPRRRPPRRPRRTPRRPAGRATRTSARAAAGDPAVERDHRSGEIRAGSRGEEDRQPRSVVGPADAPEGAVLPEMSNRALIRIRESSQSANSAGRFSRKAATASGSARPKVLMIC